MSRNRRTATKPTPPAPAPRDADKPPLVANPPRPNRLFLAVTALLLGGWMIFLAVVALVTRQ